MNYSIRPALREEDRNKLLRFSPLLSHLLFHRGLVDGIEAERFISPDYDRDIHDPFLFLGMEKAVDRLIFAIKNNEKIAIYADYDADGIPGAAMWHDFFGRINFANFIIYIPHRHDEGFGLNIDAVEQLAKEGVKLLVTLDCGISDVVPAARAKELSMELIITDHHEPPPVLPPAFAIIDHRQRDCPYPDKNLCGTGVGFKVIQGILKKERFGLKEGMEKWLLDFVGMATISDMVPLTGENRVFAYFGMSVLRKTPRKGLMKLFEKLRIKRSELSEDDLAFMITPRINAASRMGVPMDAFKLLSSNNDEEALQYALHLDEINNERKGVVASLVKEIKKKIRDRYIVSTANQEQLPQVIVMGNPIWRPSLLGLAANTCAEEFDRPVFLWGRDGDNAIKGSCRSEGRTNIVELMRAVPTGIFTHFGGHRHSGGFAVANDTVHFLEQRLNEAALVYSAQSGPVEQKIRLIDAEIGLDEVSWNLYREVAKLAPFGLGNAKPLFLLKKVIPREIKNFGKGKEHIELVFRNTFDDKISAISFFGAESDWAKETAPGKAVDLIGSLERSTFKGRPELRLRIEDVIMPS